MTTSHVQDVTPRKAADAPVEVATHSTFTEDRPTLDRLPDVGIRRDQDVDIVDRKVATRGEGHPARRARASATLGGAAIGVLIGLILGVFVSGPVWLAVVLATTLVGLLWGTAIGSLALGENFEHRGYAALAVRSDIRQEAGVTGGSAADAAWLLSARPGI